MKKIISIILSLVMVLSMSVTALAAETTSITTILRDDDMVRIAQAISGDDRYVSTFDKQNNTITTERFSVSDGTLLATATVNLSVNTITETDLNTGIAVTSTTQSKYTDSLYGYEYTPGSPAQWRLQRPKYNGEPEEGAYYYRTNQTTTNKSDLNNFRTTVNCIFGTIRSHSLRSVDACRSVLFRLHNHCNWLCHWIWRNRLWYCVGCVYSCCGIWPYCPADIE